MKKLFAFVAFATLFLAGFMTSQNASAYTRETWDGYLSTQFEDGTPIPGWQAIRYRVEDNKLVMAFSLNRLGSYARYNLYLENPSNIPYKYGNGYYPVVIKANSYGSYSSRYTLEIDPGTYNNVKVHLDCISGGCTQDVYSAGTFSFTIDEPAPEPPPKPKPWWCRWWRWHWRCR
jgi:hypothetical protein